MKILAIETSCDETAAAVVEDGVKVLSSSMATSRKLHEKTGGVVPEVAARKQVESIVPVIEEALDEAKLKDKDIDAVAVTVGPGLIGSLIVGVEAAKSLALAWNVPLIPVNHLVGHIYANFIQTKRAKKELKQNNVGAEVGSEIEFPVIALVVSGGHTDLVLMRGHGDLEYLGGTLDDAAGEAFDKTARLLGIADYLGGSELSAKAALCDKSTHSFELPRPKINDDDFDFSFSGLKTAVKRVVENENHPTEVVAHEFETAVVDVLVKKTIKAAKKHGARMILLGGGVAANKPLRSRMKNAAGRLGIKVGIPSIELCTDNAIYIASAAFFNKNLKPIDEVVADPSLGITD